MINEADLQRAIADCQGESNPNVNTCIRLAAYYIILNNMRRTSRPLNSYASEPVEKVSYYSDSEFSEASLLATDQKVGGSNPLARTIVKTAVNPIF